MISLRIFGIYKITPKIVIEAIFVLTLFGVAVTGLFEFWKFVPSIFFPDKYSRPDCWAYFINLFPSFSFSLYIFIRYLRYKPKQNILDLDKADEDVKGHKGVIFALSKPILRDNVKVDDNVKEIKDKINEDTQDENKLLEELYRMPSIGQFFRILNHHKKYLELVWPITTRDSKPYKECIDAFLKRFIPKAKICWQEGKEVNCHISDDDDAKIIKQTISILSKIYARENLEGFDFELKKSDIIVDITGGTKTLTAGLVLGALTSEINIQYLTQISGMSAARIISLSEITPEIILDKIAEYLNEIYLKKNESY